MKYCAYCGSSIAASANYCPNCGAPVSSIKKATDVFGEPADRNVGYRIVLFSKGSCSLKTAKEVLCDLLGYTSATAGDLLDNMPIEVADELTQLQAVTIAQALSEYGMEVTIVDENDTYVDFSDRATTSVFDSNGALIASAVAALASLSAVNRVHRYRRYRKPSLLSLFFRPRYVRPKPVHMRRNVVLHPEPRNRFNIQSPYSVSLRHNPPKGGPRPQMNMRPNHKPAPPGNKGMVGGFANRQNAKGKKK